MIALMICSERERGKLIENAVCDPVSWSRFGGVEELGVYSSKEREQEYAKRTANVYEGV